MEADSIHSQAQTIWNCMRTGGGSGWQKLKETKQTHTQKMHTYDSHISKHKMKRTQTHKDTHIYTHTHTTKQI